MPAPRIDINSLPSATRERLLSQFASKDSFFSPQSTEQKEEKGDKEKKRKSSPSRKRESLVPSMAPTLVRSVTVSPDGNEVRIILAVNPSTLKTAQQKGVFVGKDGHVHFFTKAPIAKAEKALKLALSPHAAHSASWGQVPIELEYNLLFPYPSSTPKKHLHKIGPHLERPDGENVVKGVTDAMTAVGFWSDDSLLANYIVKKRRTTQSPCISIRIANLMPKFLQLYRDTEELEAPTLFSAPGTVPTPAETNPLSSLPKD